jgi:hypothetical protein
MVNLFWGNKSKIKDHLLAGMKNLFGDKGIFFGDE